MFNFSELFIATKITKAYNQNWERKTNERVNFMSLLKAVPVQQKFEDGHPFANSLYFKKGDYHLHYRIDEAKGKEKAKMFMVHGFACDTEFFDEVVDIYTKNGIKCVRVDLPDFGYSTKETKGIHYIHEIELLYALMDSLDTDHSGWIIYGHSMGGSVSLELVDNDTEKRFNAIILNAPLLMFNVPGWLSKLIMIKPMRVAMDTALAYVVPLEGFFKIAEFLMTFSVKYSLGFDPQKFIGPLAIKDAGTALCYMTSKTHLPNLDQLKDIDIPAQLVTGGWDLFVFPSKAHMLVKSLPDTLDKHRIWNGGHCFLQDKPKKTAKFALDFLKSNKII